MESISFLLNILLGGTSVVAVVKWILEKRKRLAETKGIEIDNNGKQVDVDDREFETLKKQLEFQDERISNYETKLKERDEIDEKLRNDMLEIKKNKYDLESNILKLQGQLAKKEIEYDRDACMKADCPLRLSPKIN